MILLLMIQPRVLFQRWLRSRSNPWFAKILLETCRDIKY